MLSGLLSSNLMPNKMSFRLAIISSFWSEMNIMIFVWTRCRAHNNVLIIHDLFSQAASTVLRLLIISSLIWPLANLPYRRSLNAPTVCCADSSNAASSSLNLSISASRAPAAPSSSGITEFSVCFALAAPDASPNSYTQNLSQHSWIAES